MEMRRVARQNDYASRRIGLQLVCVEFFAEPDIKHSGKDGVDPILRMHVRHQLYSAGYFYPDHIGAGFCGVAYQDCETRRLGKRGKGQPLDVIGKNFAEFFRVKP